MQLPLKLPIDRLMTIWKSILDPVIASPIIQGHQISNIQVGTDDVLINHGLGRKLQGWFVVGNDSGVIIYDKQATNPNPEKTLILNVANQFTNSVIISIWVY